MKLILLAVAVLIVADVVVGGSPPAADCGAIRKANCNSRSGIYSVTVPGKTNPVQVYCDMETSGGGWTVFQRRRDGSVNFTRGWTDYANGFGKPDGEFWWGNEYISALSNARSYRLRVDLEDFEGNHTYAEYNDFKVAGAADKYRLTYCQCSYIGNAGNALEGEEWGAANFGHHGMQFTTVDQDNDKSTIANCAVAYHGGWWYNACHSCELNGEYNNTALGQGVNWVKAATKSFKFSEMKIRSVDY